MIFRRFATSTKMADTKGCYHCCVVTNPRNYEMYLCAAMSSNILLMQWYEPLSKFMVLKVGARFTHSCSFCMVHAYSVVVVYFYSSFVLSEFSDVKDFHS